MSVARAIKEINSNAEFLVLDNDVNQITWLNGTTPISAEDINAKIAEIPTDEELEQEVKTNKASGNQKLLDLGLSQAEATALTGYTPPSED